MENTGINTTCILHGTISLFMNTLVEISERNSELPDYGDVIKDVIALLFSILNDHEWSPREHAALETFVSQIRDLVYDVEDVVDNSICLAHRRQIKSHETTISATRFSGSADDSLKGIEEIISNKDMLEIQIMQAVELAATGGSSWRRDKTAPVLKDADVESFIDEEEALVKRLIIGDLKLAVVPIVGTVKQLLSPKGWVSESESSTVANKIYQNTFIMCSFKSRVWIRENGLPRQTYHELKGKRFLMIVEDTTYRGANTGKTMDTFLNDVRTYLPDDNNGSRVLLATPSSRLAAQVVGSEPMNHPHYIRHQSSPRKASRCEICSLELGRKCARVCGGRPVNINVLGSLLSEKRETFDEGQKTGNSSIDTYISEVSSEYKEILVVYFLWMPYYLKRCFLYFSVFPEDYQIRVTELIQLWIAEDFIRSTDGETLEQTGEGYLKTLIDGGVIQVVQRRWDGRVKTCTIHHLSREFCISEAQRGGMVQFLGLVNSPPLVNPRLLRTLLCFTPLSGTSGSWTHLFDNMPTLRVLKVADVGEVPNEVENLLLLKYLGLDKNSNLPDPSFLCNLLNLQTLNARSEFVCSTPLPIWNLKKLRHVFLPGPIILPLPSSTSSSSSNDNSILDELQTLSTISADSCTTEVFRKLPNLLKLGVQGDLNNLSSQSLLILKQLRTLKLARMAVFPPLKSLHGKLPKNLVKLTLCHTQLEGDPMQMLGDLQNLQVLQLLSNAFVGTKMVSSAYEFPQLQILKLVALEYMSELIIERKALPKLERLVIHDCPYFGTVQGLEHAIKVQVIDIQTPCAELRCQMEDYNEKGRYQLYIYPPEEDDEEYDDEDN